MKQTKQQVDILKSHSLFNCPDIYLQLTEAYYVHIQSPYSSK